MQLGYFKGKVLNPSDSSQISDDTPPDKRYVSKHTKLSLKDKILAVHSVLIKHLKQADVAREYRVKTHVISSLVIKAKKNPNFLAELANQKEENENQAEAILKVVIDLNKNGVSIMNLDEVIKAVELESVMKIK